MSALPGVETAGTVDALPFSGENHGGFVAPNEEEVRTPGLRNVVEVDVVGGQYLEALGVRLLDGRWFRDEETEAPGDVAIVDSVTAERFWPRFAKDPPLLRSQLTPGRASRSGYSYRDCPGQRRMSSHEPWPSD